MPQNPPTSVGILLRVERVNNPQRGQSMSSQNHCGLSIRWIRLDWLLENCFPPQSSHWDSLQKIYSELIFWFVLQQLTHIYKLIQRSPTPSSCIIFSHYCLRLYKSSKIDWDGLGIWGGEEKLWIIFSVIPPLPTCRTINILNPLCYFYLCGSDVELWILKDKVLFPVFRCPQLNWSSTMSSKVNGEKEHILGAINIVCSGHPD